MRHSPAVAAVLVLAVSLAARGDVIIDRDTTINYSIEAAAGAVQIVDGAMPPTVVEVVNPASIEVPTHVRGESLLNIRGGTSNPAIPNIAQVIAYDRAKVNFYAGAVVEGDEVSLTSHAVLNIYGGELIDDFHIDGGVTNIYGGVFPDDIVARGSATLNLFGGTLEKIGDGAALTVFSDAVIHVHVRDFEVRPSPHEMNPCCRILTGTLGDGSPIDVQLVFSDSAPSTGRFELHLTGDANYDGHVDRTDLAILTRSYGLETTATWFDGDFDANGRVDLADVGLLRSNFGKSTGSSTVAIPEPQAGVCAIGLLLLLSWFSASGMFRRYGGYERDAKRSFAESAFPSGDWERG